MNPTLPRNILLFWALGHIFARFFLSPTKKAQYVWKAGTATAGGFNYFCLMYEGRVPSVLHLIHSITINNKRNNWILRRERKDKHMLPNQAMQCCFSILRIWEILRNITHFKGSRHERKVQFFLTFFKGGGGSPHVQKLCCKFCIIQRALWQHKLRHRKDV